MSEIKDKIIGIYAVETDRDLSGNERKVKAYIHDRNSLHAYIRELSEREKFAAKASGAEQSTVFKVNYNKRLRAGLYLEFKGETYRIQSVDGYEWYERDLTLRAVRCVAEPTDFVRYEGDIECVE
jgi:SPP1 family predicted phage head-tail adaptor